MKEEKIQTLHPEEGKKNREIPLDHYEIFKDVILKTLKKKEPTHTELVALAEKQLKGRFEGNVSWYVMTVKLDLEARGLIGRKKSKPERYRLKS